MAMTKAHIDATARYNAKTYENINIRVLKGQREQIKAYAESHGESLNGYINRLIAQDMGEALTKPTKQEQDN